MSTILAIQRETNNLKLVQIQQTFNKLYFTNYAQCSLPAEAGWEGVAQKSKQMIQEHNLESQKTVLGLCSTLCFMRQLWFPFTKKDKVRQIIKFELEQSFPQDIEKTIVDFVKTEPDLNGLHPFLAAIVDKEIINSALSAFQAQDLDLDHIDLNCSGLEALAAYSSANDENPGLFVHIDWSATHILFRNNKCINKIRALSIGLKHIVQQISSHSGSDEQEVFKQLFSISSHEHLAKDTEDNKPLNEQIVTKSVADVVGRIVRDIELTVTEAGQYSDNLEIKAVYVSGLVNEFPQIQEELNKLLQLPVIKLQDKINHELLQNKDLAQNFSYLVLPAGLALAQAQKSPAFNFRREEFTKIETYTKWKKQIIYASVACAVLLVTWLGSSLFQIHILENRLHSLENKIHTVFQRAVPQSSGNFNVAQYPSIIKSRINQLQGSSSSGQSLDYNKSLPALRTISSLISDNFDIKFSLFVFDNDRIRVSGTANAFNTIENVKNTLQNDAIFSSVTIQGAKAASQNQGINFSLEIMLS